MTVPGRPVIFVAVVLVGVLLAAAAMPELVFVALLGDLVLVARCLYDGRRLAGMPVSVEREETQRLQLDVESDVVFRVENRGARALMVQVRQTWPASIEGRTLSAVLRVGPAETVRLGLPATPRRRGRVDLPPAQADVWFPGGWARRRWRTDTGASVTVYPDLQGVRQYDLLRSRRALNLLGIHRSRMIGAGWEFEQLRDYIPDDDYRNINWKATARRRRPMTNVYEAERSRDILLCLDCGRMMGNPVGRGTALDRAVDASVMLAHVAHRQGDRIGLILFRESVDLFLKPGGGRAAVQRIVEELMNANAEPGFPSYSALVESLRAGHKRRSLVFLFTDLNDPQLASDLAKVMPLLSRRHVVVTVNLRDALLERVARGPASRRADVYRVLAARQLADERAAHARDLVKQGVQILDSDADSIAMDAVNRYLQVKMRQML
ncbi:MAG: DUF58 domain-containing protein [Planctomycetota bacterium]